MKFYQSPLLIISLLFFGYGIYLQFFGQGFDQLLAPLLLVVALIGAIIHFVLKYFLKEAKKHFIAELLIILLFFGWLMLKDKF